MVPFVFGAGGLSSHWLKRGVGVPYLKGASGPLLGKPLLLSHIFHSLCPKACIKLVSLIGTTIVHC